MKDFVRWFCGVGMTCGSTVFGAGLVVLGLAAIFLIPVRSRIPVAPVAPPEGYAVHGIDVSHHQGPIDWAAVASSGRVDFAFVKATESTRHVDRRFTRNWKRARAAGVPVGAYHYFSLCRSGTDQAAHFIRHVPRHADSLPAVVDIEPDRRCNTASRWASAGSEVAAWVDAVERHYGKAPILYTSAYFYRKHLKGRIDARLWAASYTRSPRTGGRPWLFWQYTDRGWVPGILGPVDRNVFIGSPDELRALHRAPSS